MSADPLIRDHQAWLGALQPDGLVVSPAALVDSQAILNTRAIESQQRFVEAIGTIKDADGEEVPAVIDFAAFARVFLEWPDDCIEGADPCRPLPDQFTIALPGLGETLNADLAFRDPQPKDPASPWLLLVKLIEPDDDPARQLDRETVGDEASWTASPSRRFERLLRETKVPIGLLCNGTHLRLVYAPASENAGSLTFPIGFMKEVAGRPIVAALELLLHKNRLLTGPTESRLPALLRRSREYQARVSTDLAQQVIDAAFELLRGIQSANEKINGDLLRDCLAREPNKVYEGVLTVLMRMVFLLFAEDRGLMPGGTLYLQHYSVRGLFERLREDHERHRDTMDARFGAWAQLLALFRAVYGGCDHPLMKLPAREGYLFNPDRFPWLEGQPSLGLDIPSAASGSRWHIPFVPDSTVFHVLEKLLILGGERLSYRTLDVEQIGSVYEVMMGFAIGIAEGESIAIKPKKSHGAPVPINLEALLAQPGGERAKWLKAATDQELSDKPGVALKAAKAIDDLLAALEQGKKVARSATPVPVPRGAMLLVPSDERRRSGSNYTPRSLTEPIVRKTLEPILKRLGEDVKPDQILDLKVCDPAMGSGAFLVEACRQLAEVLVKAWHRHKQLPAIPPDEDELLYAKRLIAQRCLYGVDKNPMAADLAKLSMWLATLARDHPFTFLDHSFRAGDSLVGLTTAQIASFTWEPERKLQHQIWQGLIEPRINAALAARREILVAGDFMNPETKRQKLAVADEQLGLVRFIGDLIIAAFFAGEKDKQRNEKRQEFLQQLATYLGDRSKLGSGGAPGDISKRPQKFVDALRAGEKGVTPFHWPIEFPEAFNRDNPGFDAIVGNPPFLGGQKLTGAFGDPYREYLVGILGGGQRGSADLVAYFFLRAAGLVRTDGTFGLIATNTLAQGNTREVGLDQLTSEKPPHADRIVIFDAVPSRPWPGEASLEVAHVHAMVVRDGKEGWTGGFFIYDLPVHGITSFLTPPGRVVGKPLRLKANEGKSFQGSIVLGMGFVMTPEEARGLIARNPRNAEVLMPYLIGKDLNTRPDLSPSRWVINFRDWPLRRSPTPPPEFASRGSAQGAWVWGVADEKQRKAWLRTGIVPQDYSDPVAADFPDCLAVVEEKVKPERTLRKPDGTFVQREPMPTKWWIFAEKRPALYSSIRDLDRVLVIAQTSKTQSPVIVSKCVYDQKLIVFATDDVAMCGLLASSPHYNWTIQYGGTMKTDPVYAPTDCFEPFPFPETGIEAIRIAAQAFVDARSAAMRHFATGLTPVISSVNDAEIGDDVIKAVRRAYEALDRAVVAAYGWDDLIEKLNHGFHANKWGIRFTIHPDARAEILARLLALNHERHAQEVAAGLHAPASGNPKPAKAKKAKAPPAAVSGLFPAAE